MTVRHQLDLANHNLARHLSPSHVPCACRHIIAHRANENPPASSSFHGLGSIPCNLYSIISFDKLNVLDLSIARQLCDLSNTVLNMTCTMALSHVMAIENLRFSKLPPSARLTSHKPFRHTQQESQAGINWRICRLSVPVL